VLVFIFIVLVAFAIYFYGIKNIIRKLGTNRQENTEYRNSLFEKIIKIQRYITVYDASNKINKQFNLISRKIHLSLGLNLIVSATPKIVIETMMFLGIIILVNDMERQTLIQNDVEKMLFMGLMVIRALPEVQKLFHVLTRYEYGKASILALSKVIENNQMSDKTKTALADSNKDLEGSIIEFYNVGIQFKNHIIEGLSLKISKNKLTIIKGPSGSGKSTILDIIMGIKIPSEGKVKVKSKDPTFSYVGQKALLPDGTIEEVLDLLNYGLGNNEENLFFDSLVKLNLINEKEQAREFIKRDCGELSGGQTQKLLIAYSLSKTSDIIVMDEPTSALDEISTRNFKNLIQYELERHPDKKMIIVSHDTSLDDIASQIIKIG
jgi:ABC-type Mn2+/Zn2+ transport system ATPase subunit